MNDRPLPPGLAIVRIRQLWAKGEVTWTHHAEARLAQRGLDVLDVAHCLRYGRVTETSHPGRRWRYSVEGTTVERRRMRCVVEIVGSLVIVTLIA
jgi:hypothetical protein